MPRKFQLFLQRNLQFFVVVGSNPYKQNYLSYFLQVKTLISFGTLLYLTTSQLWLNEWKGVDSLSNFDYLSPVFLGFAKTIFFIFNMKPLKKLIDGFENYWELDKFGVEMERKILKTHDSFYKFAKIYAVACVVIGILIFILPFVFHNRNLIFPMYEFCDVTKFPCFEIVYTWQTYLLFLEYFPTVLAFDTFFLSLIVYPYMALELIKCSFNRLNLIESKNGKAKENLMEIVVQHNVILDSISEINKIFSKMLMVQYWSGLVSQIFALYMLTEDGIPPDSTRVTRYGVIYIIFICQLFMYSFGGMLLIEQTTSVAEEAYAVDWYVKTQPDLRKSLAFIILRSHRPNKIKIGNMTDLDLVSFISIVKNALSVYALLRQLQEEKLEN